MIQEAEKRYKKAVELVLIWDRWFPSLVGQAPIDYWMVMLDDYRMNTLAEAIRRCARQRTRVPMSLPEMQTFISDVAPQIAGVAR
jgi:hypothetical protein